MNDQILYTDEKRAIERWENEVADVLVHSEVRKHST